MNAQLIDLQKIWDNAPHNALTDLIRFQNTWICAFREGSNHISPDGKLRILVSGDGRVWESGALLEIPGMDLRDPKLSLTPSGELLLNAGGAFNEPTDQRHQSFVWLSSNGREWIGPHKIGEPNFWMWRITWHKEAAYGTGYSTVDPAKARLYFSQDGVHFSVLVDNLFEKDFPNEASLAFDPEDIAYCLLRRDAGIATAQLGTAKPPYTDWKWTDLGVRIGGPNLFRLPDGCMIAAVRRYGKEPWTSINWLDPAEGNLREFLALPSGGDTSYAGVRYYGNILWVSYYSSHEGHASIYLAKIRLQ